MTILRPTGPTAEACAACHVGDGLDREVNHDLIAAGHPRLNFELTLLSRPDAEALGPRRRPTRSARRPASPPATRRRRLGGRAARHAAGRARPAGRSGRRRRRRIRRGAALAGVHRVCVLRLPPRTWSTAASATHRGRGGPRARWPGASWIAPMARLLLDEVEPDGRSRRLDALVGAMTGRTRRPTGGRDRRATCSGLARPAGSSHRRSRDFTGRTCAACSVGSPRRPGARSRPRRRTGTPPPSSCWRCRALLHADVAAMAAGEAARSRSLDDPRRPVEALDALDDRSPSRPTTRTAPAPPASRTRPSPGRSSRRSAGPRSAVAERIRP